MKEIYMHESKMPKSCRDCRIPAEECPCDVHADCVPPADCPIRSLEAHDAAVRKAAIEEFAECLEKQGGVLADAPLYGLVKVVRISSIKDIAKELIKNG